MILRYNLLLTCFCEFETYTHNIKKVLQTLNLQKKSYACMSMFEKI